MTKPNWPILHPGMSDEAFAKAVAEGERITEARNREAANRSCRARRWPAIHVFVRNNRLTLLGDFT